MGFMVVPHGSIRPNPWNPNTMSPFMYAKELDSIREHGMIDPVLVRETEYGRYEIIDGEHRWRACGDLGMPDVPVWNMGIVEDERARRLTITMNELRGQSDPAKMSLLLQELSSMTPVTDLIERLPFTPEYFQAMVGVPSPSLGALPTDHSPLPPAASGEGGRRWVERTYRLPPEAAEVLDQAIARAKGDDPDASDAWALEMIAADFLGNL